MKNIIIIGGGVAGLAAGCRLSARGASVIVLEANDNAGGCCGTTCQAGFTFHDGAVSVTLPRTLDIAFATLSLDRTALVPLRRVTPMFSARLFDGTVVTWRDCEDVRVDGAAFDRTRLEIDVQRLLARWGPVLDLVNDDLLARPLSSWRALRKSWKHLGRLRGTVEMEIRRLVSDHRVRAALFGALLHTRLAPEDMPAPSILALVGLLRDGVFLPEGGMSAIPRALATALRQRGGELRCRSRVTRIVVEHGRACGVEVNGEQRLDTATVIAAISPMAIFTTLIDTAHVPRSIARRVSRAALSQRAVSVQFGLANHIDAAAVLNMVVPAMERQNEVAVHDPFDVRWPLYSVPTRVQPELAPAGQSIVEMVIPLARNTAFPEWDSTARQAVADAALTTLRRFHSLDVAVRRVRTPEDFASCMHLFGGAPWGLSPATAPHAHFAHQTAIDGLLLAGQSTYPGYGVAPAMMSGIFAADAALRTRAAL